MWWRMCSGPSRVCGGRSWVEANFSKSDMDGDMMGAELLLLQELGRAGAHSPRISFMSLLFGMLQVCAPSRPSSTNEIVVCWQDEISTRRKKERSKPDEPAALPSEDFAEVRKRPDGEDSWESDRVPALCCQDLAQRVDHLLEQYTLFARETAVSRGSEGAYPNPDPTYRGGYCRPGLAGRGHRPHCGSGDRKEAH